MSTLPGQASKGDKSKPKYMILDINNLYKNSRGENSEKTQQKNSSTTVKYGMQSLGRVPNARRPPANLPSIKSEHSGTDQAVALIPPGGTGWGKQDSTSTTTSTVSTTTTTSQNITTNTTNSNIQQQPQLSSHQANIALPVNVTIPPPQKPQPPPQQQQQQQQQQQPQQPPTQPSQTSSIVPSAGTTDKLWSTVTIGQDSIHHPPPYQSAQFQQEFPSLSAGGDGGNGGGGNGRTIEQSQYQSGISLRPQTEGSWIQGGASRVGNVQETNSRPGSAPLGAPPQLTAPAGQQQSSPPQLPQQLLKVLPPFMYKGNFGQTNQQQTGQNNTTQQNNVVNGRNLRPDRPPRLISNETDEITPIVKMEELNRMDEIGTDMGWAGQDDIDYSQKLSFSDDESDMKKPSRREPIKQQQQQQQQEYYNDTNRASNNNWQRERQTHDDDFIRCKKDVDQAVQLAILRKEEEEKRFSEGTKARANKKLHELEQRIVKRNGENLKAKTPDIPLPDFQKEKERNEQQQQQQQKPQQNDSSASDDNKSNNNFRQLTQIEGKSFQTTNQQQQQRKPHTKIERDQNGPSFSRQFQNDLPPRFLKARNNSSSNIQAQTSSSSTQQTQSHYFNDNRWQSGNKSRNIRQDSPERDHVDNEYKRQSSEDSYRERHSDDYRRDKDKRHDSQSDTSSSSNWHDQRRDDRPARPDSRDSRSTRHSRDSEPRDLGSWSESYESSYDEKKRDHSSRQVPGPITKERIEQDDLRNEKRNLTQLKRVDKKIEIKKDEKLIEQSNDDEKIKDDLTSSWADAIPSALDQIDDKSMKSSEKLDMKSKNDDYKDRRNRGGYPTNKSWGSNEYRSTTWNKRQPSSRGHRMGTSNRPSSQIEYHNTDSDGSFDERSPKPIKKFDKDEKNKLEKQKLDKRDSYVPKGEPTRHGRGGSSSSFRGSRVGGLSKRIDAYGPPQTKQPFSSIHSDDKEKKSNDDLNNDLSSDDKAKQNQQALSAGLQAKNKDDKIRSNKLGKLKNKNDDNCDTNSENSDEKNTKLSTNIGHKTQLYKQSSNNSIRNQGPPPQRRNQQPPPRLGGNQQQVTRQNSNLQMKKDEKIEQNVLCNAIADISLKNRCDDDERDEKSSFNGDTEGFQEVKSKKNVKKIEDNKQTSIGNKDIKKDLTNTKMNNKKTVNNTNNQLTQQNTQNIPPLMGTPVNPPPIMKNQYDRSRQAKLAPRFAKAKLQKAAQMQQIGGNTTNNPNNNSGLCDVSDINKSLYGMKDNNSGNTNVTSGNTVNNSGQVSCSAWDKPLGGSQMHIEHDTMLSVPSGLDSVKGLEQTQSVNQGGVSPNHDKIIGKGQLQDKNLLDGTTPPVNTIIFENTNFKSTPVPRTNNRATDKTQTRSKLDESPSPIDAASVISGFNKPIIGQDTTKSDTMPLPLSFKEDNADMKLDFFGTDLSHLTDEKTTTSSKNLMKTMHSITSTGSVNSNTICTADSLNIKIASVKKVWETSEHGQVDDNNTSFSNSFVSDPNTLDPNNVFSKQNDTPDDNHEVYSPSPNQTASTTTNVCKVKPTQQVSGSSGQTVLSSTSHQQHSGIVPPSLMGNPLSPPPMQPVIGAGVGIGQPPQQYTTNQHLGYQAGLGGSGQYGMSTIPSPPTVPTVLYNSTQPLQAAQTGLYGTFQIDQSGVLGNQGRSQYSQYPNHYGLGQTASSPYSTQSVYLPATPAHPPPPPPSAPELYTNSYRLSATAPFGQNQQLNNPTTVLISSTSNSLMSASVKPSSQQISAIGTKSGGVGPAYQQQSQQGQVYIPYDPSIQANYLSGGGVMQRAPTGPVQNNVLQSSSYYSQSTGGQTGYFQQPGNSTLQSAQLQQHQTGFGLQTNVFGQHNQSHTNAGVQNYNSHFLSTPMQMAAITAQYRNSLPPYMKTVGNQPNLSGENRPQQLKSPSSQEVLSSVFNSGSQISSPKSKQNSKHPPPQSSPTAQQKYLYQGISHQTGNVQRYPTPIQRPVNNFQNMNMQQNNANNQKHRSNNSSNKPPNRQYYGQRNTNTNNTTGTKAATLSNSGSASGGGVGAVSVTSSAASDIVKDSIKEEATTLKD